MTGVRRTYKHRGKKRLRRTPYRYISVREHDYLNVRRLSDKHCLSIVDTIALLVGENLRIHGLEPLTAEDLARFERIKLNLSGMSGSPGVTDSTNQ